jgi:hypothetical protein
VKTGVHVLALKVEGLRRTTESVVKTTDVPEEIRDFRSVTASLNCPYPVTNLKFILLFS